MFVSDVVINAHHYMQTSMMAENELSALCDTIYQHRQWCR